MTRVFDSLQTIEELENEEQIEERWPYFLSKSPSP
jgi:hypothetical protein